jgi:ubiquitin-protein ligase
MDLSRIRREISDAQQQFSYVESHPTRDGRLYVLAALQSTRGQIYTAEITFPDSYPNSPPHVVIRRPAINAAAPHKFSADRICYMHSSMWNPGYHSLTTVLMRTAKWIAKYEVWSVTGSWAGAQVAH